GQAAALSPGDRASRAARGALLRRAGRWEDLVAERRAEAEDGGPGAPRALREAGAILARKLGKPTEAAEVYRQLSDRAPDDAAARARRRARRGRRNARRRARTRGRAARATRRIARARPLGRALRAERPRR